ncbi:MAG TPA: S8 family serine peptidase [Ignavibacteria bacterium]|nr:S8 family serine peptidase [Ignavibacteria bacterium]
MNKIIYLFPLLIVFLMLPLKLETHINNQSGLYSKYKFFVKTKSDLKVSEATGKISLQTGIESMDEKINKYHIKDIKKVFRLNNGNPVIYSKYGMSRIYVFTIDENKGEFSNIEEIVNNFSKDKEVEFSEPNYIGFSAGVKGTSDLNSIKNILNQNEPNDEMFYKQWYLKNNGSLSPTSGGNAKVGADIKILNTWEIETGSEEVIVAILDSGIKDDHPDLKEKIWINKEEIPGNGFDDDNNGYIDDYKGWDFAYDDRRPEDGFGHGTNIATVIGASTDNLLGFSGINKRCKLMNSKNLNADNTGEYEWWSESIKYSVDNGARIINMSEGGDDYSRVLQTAINYAQDNNVLIVAAMMNKGDGRNYYPASLEGVFAVGATDTDDNRCRKFSWGGGSCWGKHIAVVAPGNKIYGLDFENDYNFEVFWSGTSQSTAIVSGIASLLLSQNKLRSAEEIKRIIKLSSKDLVGDPREDKPGWDKYYGYGRVDSYAALSFDNNNVYKEPVTDPYVQSPDSENEEDVIENEKKNMYDNDNDDENDKPAKAVDKKSSEPDRK